MSALVEDFLALDREAFLAAHPDALMVVDNPGEEGENASFQTLAAGGSGDTSSARHGRLLERLGAARWAFVLERDENKFASMRTVGRDANSDVRLNVPSVSKFHAYFTHVARESAWYLADANSSNGTFLNGAELPPSHGKVRLDCGATLRFGPDVTAAFYDAEGFWQMLEQRMTETPERLGD